jgi:DNA-binding response OmpR family regulator
MAEKVLIVDDDTRLSAMLRDYLSGSGFSVELAATAQSGLTA